MMPGKDKIQLDRIIDSHGRIIELARIEMEYGAPAIKTRSHGGKIRQPRPWDGHGASKGRIDTVLLDLRSVHHGTNALERTTVKVNNSMLKLVMLPRVSNPEVPEPLGPPVAWLVHLR